MIVVSTWELSSFEMVFKAERKSERIVLGGRGAVAESHLNSIGLCC